MTVTIDELMDAVTTFQNRSHRALMSRNMDGFMAARADLERWCKENGLPIEFPDEADVLSTPERSEE